MGEDLSERNAIAEPSPAAQAQDGGLSPAEKEVAMLTLKGLRITEIARMRGCTEGTVKSHLSAIFRKSQVSSRPECLARFVNDFLDFAAVK